MLQALEERTFDSFESWAVGALVSASGEPCCGELRVIFKLSQSHAHLSLALLSVFSETLSVPTFHYIYNNLLRYYEMIMVEKKEAIVWGRRSVDGLVMPFGAVDRPRMVVLWVILQSCGPKVPHLLPKWVTCFFSRFASTVSAQNQWAIKTD